MEPEEELWHELDLIRRIQDPRDYRAAVHRWLCHPDGKQCPGCDDLADTMRMTLYAAAVRDRIVLIAVDEEED